MKIYRTILSALLLVCILLVSSPLVFAADSSSSAVIKKMTHVSNLFEKVGEKIGLYFRFSNESKLDYMEKTLETRLGEIDYVFNDDRLDRLEETTSRYSTYLANIDKFIEDKKLFLKKDELKKILIRQRPYLEFRRDSLEYGSGLWMLASHAVNSNKITEERINSLH